MQETLQLPVTYDNQEVTFKAHVIHFGYVHHIVVDVKGTQATIERDEEGNYRAIIRPENMARGKADKELIGGIVDVVQSL